MSLRAAVFLGACAFAATVSFADPAPQNAPGSPGSTAAQAPDPNEVVCERQEEIGSRLGSKRVCMTRSQWAEQKTQDRQQLEKTQVQRGMYDPH
jgi:hypothetical protein